MNNVKTVERDEWGVRGIKGKAMVSSRVLAERFDKEHKDVLRVIRNKAKEAQEEFDTTGSTALLDFNQRNFTPVKYRDSKGESRDEFQITKDGFAFIAMGFTGAKASLAKVEYIQRYNAMEDFIFNRGEARDDYKELVEIQRDNGATNWDFANEADMINLIVLGKKAKAYRESLGITDKETRAYLTPQQIQCIAKLQKMDMGFIEADMGFSERKERLTKYYHTKLLPKITQ